jgi:hypothetical protein
MTFMLATSVAVLTAWTVGWGQRRCEVWAYARDKDL